MQTLTVDFIISLDGYGAAEGWPGLWGWKAPSIFSSTLEAPLTWANSRLIAEDAVQAVRAMKESSDTSMRTLGSVSLRRDLLRAGLVDRFQVVVFPVITGATGRDRIFDGYPDVRLELVESRLFDGRLQLLEYVPTPLDGPPEQS